MINQFVCVKISDIEINPCRLTIEW